MYMYLLDVSHNAISTGYLSSFCEILLENLDKVPGDSRTQIGFITYHSSIHFYNLSSSLSQPRMMIYTDIDDLELPSPDSLIVNLNENRETIQMFLQSLPNMFANNYQTDSALGTALNAGFQLVKATGGRITVMQTCLPNVGVGALKVRDESIDKDSTNLAPQSDFYKKLALECAGLHIAVDLFLFNSLYADISTLCKCFYFAFCQRPSRTILFRINIYLFIYKFSLCVKVFRRRGEILSGLSFGESSGTSNSILCRFETVSNP